MSDFRPSRVYATLSNKEEFVSPHAKPKSKKMSPGPDEDQSIRVVNQQMVEVSATGELCLPPDRCAIHISVSSSKEQVQDVKNSVQRRVDYIMQTLHNHQIKEADIHTNKVLRRIDSIYYLTTEVQVQFSDFPKSESLRNLLVEKLDDSVSVSLPEFFQSPQRPANLRKEACLTAVKNAKQKALAIAQLLGARLGPALAVREDAVREWQGPSEDHVITMDSLQHRIDQATVNVEVKVTASFQLTNKVKSKEHT